MKASDIPASKFPIPFAADAGGSYIRPIPEASQIGVVDGAASLHDGFPPLTFIPRASGGVPPFGQDFNGIMLQTTSWTQWFNAGGAIPWDGTFSTAIGGYPKGSIVESATTDGVYWRSTADDNTTNPDIGGANWATAWRTRLSANTTFYVTTTGNDTTGNGTVGSPWLTIQHAINAISQNYDLNGFIATINIGAGTFAGFRIDAPIIGASGPATLLINGASAATTIFSSAVVVDNAAVCTINGLTFAGGGISSLLVSSFATVYLATTAPVTFPTNTGGIHINSSNNGIITINGNYNVTGGAGAHLNSVNLGNIIFQAGTCTLTGTPAFSSSFANAATGSLIQASPGVFSGAATGIRYSATLNSVINTNSGGATYFPGNSAGSTATGGQYA